MAKRRQQTRLGRALAWVSNAIFHLLIDAARVIPYRARIPLWGWAVAHVLGWPFGLRRRAMLNLSLALPDIAPDARKRIARDALDNLGRVMMETYSKTGFLNCVASSEPEGPGWQDFQDAVAAGRPIIIFSAHFGNYNAVRSVLQQRGHEIGVLYRRFENPHFERRHRAIQASFGLFFERSRAGMAAMLRHLNTGGTIAIVGDQHVWDGEILTFFGHPAATSTTAARLAMKHDALLIPIYAIRRPDGLHFDVIFHAPIPHSDVDRMTQALNDNLETQVRQYPGQWLWTHRRWKTEKPAKKLPSLETSPSAKAR
ncbi:MAG: lysophospholipid acyltransferase family protein [Pseudomonadota bacterium]